MESKEFAHFRAKLGKTQKQMAQLLGTSIKAIHSYEQGWRSIPGHVERQILFLAYQRLGKRRGQKSCWVIKQCPADQQEQCPAREFNAGKLCWFICGTICEGTPRGNWKEKMSVCRSCDVFNTLMKPITDE